jgi:hypothetical protein
VLLLSGVVGSGVCEGEDGDEEESLLILLGVCVFNFGGRDCWEGVDFRIWRVVDDGDISPAVGFEFVA